MVAGRFYRLIFKSDVKAEAKQEMKEQIIEEIRSLPNVKSADFTDDPEEGLVIFTEDGEYSEVMNSIVNIMSREAAGTELSFRRFVPVE